MARNQRRIGFGRGGYQVPRGQRGIGFSDVHTAMPNRGGAWWDGPGWHYAGPSGTAGGGAAGSGAAGGGAGGGGQAPGAPGGGDTMGADGQSAFAYMQRILEDAGLGSLAPVLQNLILGGMTDTNQLQLALQDTPEWKTRFAGNERLKAAGLPVLSVGEYLATERQYAQVMKNYGLPAGFYDDPSDFAGFIGSSVSPAEVQQRVSAWSDLAKREDPAIKAQLASMGIGEGELTAYMMDPERAQPLIQQTYQKALLGGAARRQGLVSDNSTLGRLAAQGVTEQQAIQGFGLISENLATAERLGSIYGEQMGQSDLEAEVFENDGKATNKRKRLASRERAAFGGSSGVGQGSLSRRDSGSY